MMGHCQASASTQLQGAGRGSVQSERPTFLQPLSLAPTGNFRNTQRKPKVGHITLLLQTLQCLPFHLAAKGKYQWALSKETNAVTELAFEPSLEGSVGLQK
jgi:hypothetical protein